MTSNEQIASTILSQFGRTFDLMVGMESAVVIENGIQFSHAKGNKGINKLVVTLNARDTYDLAFWKITSKTAKEVVGVGEVYNNQLAGVFENVTGLLTHF